MAAVAVIQLWNLTRRARVALRRAAVSLGVPAMEDDEAHGESTRRLDDDAHLVGPTMHLCSCACVDVWVCMRVCVCARTHVMA
jgi:hypothetical protein